MIDTPQIVQTGALRTAVIPMIVPRAEIRQVMGPAVRELFAELKAQGVNPVGPWYTHHFKIPDDVFDFEAGVPVDGEVAAAGRIRPSELLAATVARTIYHGDYEGLPAAWGQFRAWIDDNGYQSAPDLWECYIVGPESSHDPAAWQTELNRPLIAI